MGRFSLIYEQYYSLSIVDTVLALCTLNSFLLRGVVERVFGNFTKQAAVDRVIVGVLLNFHYNACSGNPLLFSLPPYCETLAVMTATVRCVRRPERKQSICSNTQILSSKHYKYF